MKILSFEVSRSQVVARLLAMPAMGIGLAITSGLAQAGACDQSTAAAFKACNLSAESDYNNALGICDNIKAQPDRQHCVSQALNDQAAAQKLCSKQQTGRQRVCNALGQAPYDPVIRPNDFFTRVDNPLLPMKPGDIRTYKNGKSTVTVTVTDQTIKLRGV